MKDETYLFYSDCRDKKNTARSARRKRTHNGKSGRVKLPSDYMTKKELNAMNGEVKSYRLNEPMTWKEFKKMPDDIKVTYIKLLRERFNVADTHIAEMMDITRANFSQEMKRLGLNTGHRNKNVQCDKEGFYAWVGGASVTKEAEDPIPEEPVPEDVAELVMTREQYESLLGNTEEAEKNVAIPCTGHMTYEGKVEDILKSVRTILGNSNAKVSIYWEIKEDGK